MWLSILTIDMLNTYKSSKYNNWKIDVDNDFEIEFDYEIPSGNFYEFDEKKNEIAVSEEQAEAFVDEIEGYTNSINYEDFWNYIRRNK
jgi:hypothetical protein